MSDVHNQLRKKFDGADSFVAGGHIVRGGGSTRHTERLSRTPEWVNDDVKVREFLLRVFPKLVENDTQRKRAAKWLAVLNMYFRMGRTSNAVAQELRITENYVKVLVCRIKRAMNGVRSDIAKPKSGKIGRPRKVSNDSNIQVAE